MTLRTHYQHSFILRAKVRRNSLPVACVFFYQTLGATSSPLILFCFPAQKREAPVRPEARSHFFPPPTFRASYSYHPRLSYHPLFAAENWKLSIYHELTHLCTYTSTARATQSWIVIFASALPARICRIIFPSSAHVRILLFTTTLAGLFSTALSPLESLDDFRRALDEPPVWGDISPSPRSLMTRGRIYNSAPRLTDAARFSSRLPSPSSSLSLFLPFSLLYWNNVPCGIKSSASINSFKEK